jgi:hypothetical protein
LSSDRRHPISDELHPYVDREEAEALEHVGQQLAVKRPVPALGFRVELRARLRGRKGEDLPPSTRPRRLGAAVTAYVGAGTVILAAAALGLTGAGPLAP